jgi:serine/threonine protein kinase
MSDHTNQKILTPNRTWLARDAAGRQVVLKLLEKDCLQNDTLHPLIHDRLARVRELAHPGVANLYGVERDGDHVLLVWEFLPGQTLADWNGSRKEFSDLARELIISVQTLHNLGIVHGRLRERNIILDLRGRPCLTHISPLLFHEPSADARELRKMLNRLAKVRGWTSPISPEGADELGDMLGEIDSPTSPVPLTTEPRQFPPMLAATVATLAAIALAGAIIYGVRAHEPTRISPPQGSVAPRSSTDNSF